MPRPRKPVGAKILDGNYREDRDGRPLAARAGQPAIPAWLDDVGQRVWHRTMAELGGVQGLLSPVDADCLALYCDAWSTYLRCRETVLREGDTVKGREGAVVKHPATVLKKQAEQTILNVGGKFGLNPVSRASLAIDCVNVINGVRRRTDYVRDTDGELEDLIR